MVDETRLWLIRHAPVAGPPDVIHAPDAPADIGDKPALAALRALLPAGAPAFVSPAQRTLDTAVALGLEATEDPDLREQNFGDWTGHRHDDLAATRGVEYTLFWRAPARRRPPGGGESFFDQITRVRRALEKLPTGDVILVVHSGTVRAALAIALDLSPERALNFVISPLSLTRLDRLGNVWRIEAVNRR